MGDRTGHLARGFAAAAALVLLVSCSGIHQVDTSALPSPSADSARTLSYRACSRAVREYGVVRVARYLHATGTRPMAIGRAYARTALSLTDGWRPYRSIGVRACAAGVRAAIA